MPGGTRDRISCDRITHAGVAGKSEFRFCQRRPNTQDVVATRFLRSTTPANGNVKGNIGCRASHKRLIGARAFHPRISWSRIQPFTVTQTRKDELFASVYRLLASLCLRARLSRPFVHIRAFPTGHETNYVAKRKDTRASCPTFCGLP